jgi:ABC-2 type transport system permease protein
MTNILTLAKREFRSYFDSLVAYVVVAGTMLGVGLWFFKGFWETDRASMSRMTESLPWALALLVIPLITMRTLAEEKRSGTMELLITFPVTDSEVILGKYVAAMGLVFVLLGISLLYPMAMFVGPWHLGAFDWGPLWSAYLGLFLFSAAGVALGLMFSSLTESQIIAFFFTAATLALLQTIGLLVETFKGDVGDAIAFVSFQTRYNPFSRGLIDTRAIVYFLSVAVMCLLVAFRSLESRKWK